MDKHILVLDDDPIRMALFSNRMNDQDRGRTHWVKTAKEAIETLKIYGDIFDKIYLDHDLGEPGYEQDSRSEESGMEVVRYLEKQKRSLFKEAKFIVHSWNFPSATRMVARLQNAGYHVIHQPFGTGDI